MQVSLFENEVQTPLANRLRPTTLEEYVGQQHLVGKGKILDRMLTMDTIPSMIFWGPPGVGKTTLARIIAATTKAEFIDFSAVTSGIKEIKTVMKKAEETRILGGKTILFVDEIHRFNKAQQDAFLPYVEKGSITLIGATTENPSFEVNGALLSRCKVFVLKALDEKDIYTLLQHALVSEKGYKYATIKFEDGILEGISRFASGDARTALNTLEMLVLNGTEVDDAIYIDKQLFEDCTSKKSLLYDKKGEEHYNIISALHKSMRNSDVDASIYWLARMLEAGENPLYIARRLVRFASEDVGMADSRALEICVACYQACHFIGMPECSVHLTHAVTYLSLAPKSNSLYMAYEKAKQDANEHMAEPVPLHLRNAPTKLMQELEYGVGYEYAHDDIDHITGMRCMPGNLEGHTYYHPSHFGSEEKVQRRMQQIEQLRNKKRGN